MKAESLNHQALIHEVRRADRCLKLFYVEDEDRFIMQTYRRGHLRERRFNSGEEAERAFRLMELEWDLR